MMTGSTAQSLKTEELDLLEPNPDNEGQPFVHATGQQIVVTGHKGLAGEPDSFIGSVINVEKQVLYVINVVTLAAGELYTSSIKIAMGVGAQVYCLAE